MREPAKYADRYDRSDRQVEYRGAPTLITPDRSSVAPVTPAVQPPPSSPVEESVAQTAYTALDIKTETSESQSPVHPEVTSEPDLNNQQATARDLLKYLDSQVATHKVPTSNEIPSKPSTVQSFDMVPAPKPAAAVSTDQSEQAKLPKDEAQQSIASSPKIVTEDTEKLEPKDEAKTPQHAPSIERPHMNGHQVSAKRKIKHGSAIFKHRVGSAFGSNKTLYTAASFIFMIGVGVSTYGVIGGGAITDASSSKSATTTNSKPSSVPVLSEEKPTAGDYEEHAVNATNPRYLQISSADVDARVFSLSAKANNEIGTPENIFDTGWYKDSAIPGEPGATLINGHVTGPTKSGVFSKLDSVKAGDEMVVVRGDDRRLIYKVAEVENIQAEDVDMVKLLSPIQAGTSGLNIVTTAGKINKQTQRYDNRIIVYATLQP